MNENQMKKLQGFNQNRHKTCKINNVFLFLLLLRQGKSNRKIYFLRNN
jgi:hypothetical protein